MSVSSVFSGFVRRQRERWRQAWRSPGGRWVVLSHVVALAVLLGVALGELGPMLRKWNTYGFHDWDIETAYRYITVVSLKQHGEGPWWHPWLCGGFPAFGHVEGATNLVSPYLPLYLLADIRVAIRLEVLGGALTSLLGCYLLAGRFTRSSALRALVAVLFALNGRWSLQIATGHTWHLQYGWLPWALWFFDRSQDDRRLHEALYAGALVALIVFMGGIYPLPHTALILTAYALLLAAFRRSPRPLFALAITGSTALGLAAPKLFAIVDTMSRAPRLIDSKEVIGLSDLLVMMTNREQTYGSFPVRVPAYNWHEWGLYVGVAGVAVLTLGLLFAKGVRENALKLIGFSLFLLGLGAFHEHAPWAWLHKLPVFASQHVPSRFHYPMVLVLSLAFVAWAGRWIDRELAIRRWLDLALLVPVLAVGLDVASVASRPFGQAFWMEKPEKLPWTEPFEHQTKAPVAYRRPDWAAPILLSMMANTGVIECYGIDPGFKGIGAVGADKPAYRGRAYLAEGPGRAEVVEWSPNRATVKVTGASPGALVVYNMNWDPSWRANGEPAKNHGNAVAGRLEPGSDTVTFRYFPRTFRLSVPLFLLTLAAAIGVPWWWRRRRARLGLQSGSAGGITPGSLPGTPASPPVELGGDGGEGGAVAGGAADGGGEADGVPVDGGAARDGSVERDPRGGDT